MRDLKEFNWRFHGKGTGGRIEVEIKKGWLFFGRERVSLLVGLWSYFPSAVTFVTDTRSVDVSTTRFVNPAGIAIAFVFVSIVVRAVFVAGVNGYFTGSVTDQTDAGRVVGVAARVINTAGEAVAFVSESIVMRTGNFGHGNSSVKWCIGEDFLNK